MHISVATSGAVANTYLNSVCLESHIDSRGAAKAARKDGGYQLTNNNERNRISLC